MIKRTQNKVAESRFTLPVVMAYAIAVWLASGLLLPSIPFSSNILLRGAWVQFVSFLLSAFLMVELNNGNALIRIFSRMVSSSFIVLACAANMLFGSMAGAIVQLCVVASLTTFFHSYQDKQSMGWIFYTFLFIGLASTVFVQILYWYTHIVEGICYAVRKAACNEEWHSEQQWQILLFPSKGNRCCHNKSTSYSQYASFQRTCRQAS